MRQEQAPPLRGHNAAMLMYPHIDPIAIRLGPLAIHWYGITYLVAFGLFYFLATRRLRHPQFAAVTQPAPWSRRDIEDMLFWGVVGVIVGGRLGLPVLQARVLRRPPAAGAGHLGRGHELSRRHAGRHRGHGFVGAPARPPWLQVTDLVAPCVPLGLASGRVGNFINGELWGRFAPPELPWAMVFPQSGSMLPRHPRRSTSSCWRACCCSCCCGCTRAARAGWGR
jgi:phosphatidylglycerol:prolipoprotein diacylglycerol transferase